MDLAFSGGRFREERFQVYVESIDDISDANELANLQIRDNLTGKDYKFSIWAEDYESQTYEPYYVFLNNPSAIDFNQEGDIQHLIDNALYQGTLFDLIEEDKALEKSIIEGYENGRQFKIEIPYEKQQVNFVALVADEEIIKIIRDIDEQKLTKEQLIQFGENFDKEEVEAIYDTDTSRYLEDKISQFIRKNEVTKEEQKQIEKSVESLQLDSKNVQFNNPKRSNEKKRRAFEMER